MIIAETLKMLLSLLRGRAVVARQAHNLKVGGSIPSPATNNASLAQLARARDL